MNLRKLTERLQKLDIHLKDKGLSEADSYIMTREEAFILYSAGAEPVINKLCDFSEVIETLQEKILQMTS
jgi:hypothetical protein